jgi:hypothetical protein
MRRPYASFATSTALPRTAYLAKCRRVASSFSHGNRPPPAAPPVGHHQQSVRLAIALALSASARLRGRRVLMESGVIVRGAGASFKVRRSGDTPRDGGADGAANSLGGQRGGNHEKRGDSADDQKPAEHWTSLLGPNLAYHLARLSDRREAEDWGGRDGVDQPFDRRMVMVVALALLANPCAKQWPAN